jgi:hypothetical protein
VQGEWSGYPLQVLGLLRASASLWAFRFYPYPERVVLASILPDEQTVTKENSRPKGLNQATSSKNENKFIPLSL